MHARLMFMQTVPNSLVCQLFISGRGEEVQQTVRVLQEGKRLTTVALLFIRTCDCLKPITLLRGCVAAGLEP